jgi:DNA-binding CsgD family transcriptional regulator
VENRSRSATETAARAVAAIQGDARSASGSLLDLLEEADNLMHEVQFVLRRIGVELDLLGILPRALPEPSRPKACGEFDSLSRRESEVVLLLLAGSRVSSIARALFISRHTVRNHLQSIFRKLRVNSQAELIEKLKGSSGWTRSPRKGRAVGVAIDSNTLRCYSDISGPSRISTRQRQPTISLSDGS